MFIISIIQILLHGGGAYERQLVHLVTYYDWSSHSFVESGDGAGDANEDSSEAEFCKIGAADEEDDSGFIVEEQVTSPRTAV
mmetsp:Transcript_18484/g.38848  ORF Transcript_18484/g.38848 Transcript_18484/m.38848 type:complete len:82 (+) Transcript_18484:78-323(+)